MTLNASGNPGGVPAVDSPSDLCCTKVPLHVSALANRFALWHSELVQVSGCWDLFGWPFGPSASDDPVDLLRNASRQHVSGCLLPWSLFSVGYCSTMA